MFRHIITLLMFCCISFNANAQVIALKNNHPDRYVVVKGDTLWGISGKFLKEKNPAIQIIGAQPDDNSKIPGIRKIKSWKG